MHCLYTSRFATNTESRTDGDAAMVCQVMGKDPETSVRVCVGRGPRGYLSLDPSMTNGS